MLLSPARWPALGLVALVIACGGGGKAPLTPTRTSTPLLPPATSTPSIDVPADEMPVVQEATPACADPYPAGAPYEPAAGQPFRLRRTGSPPALARFEPIAFETDSALDRVVRDSLGGDAPHVAVVVKNLADGRGVALDYGRVFYAASLYKTWVMLEAFHQRSAALLDFGEQYIVSDYYQALGLNPGELQACEEVVLSDALTQMMRISDNVAANLLLDRVGPGNVNSALRGLGLTVSGVNSDDQLPTTALDMALLLEVIARRQTVDVAASDEMLALLGSESIADRLPALLPPDTSVAHKTGSWSTATHDAGIVYSPQATYVVVVLTDFGYEDDGASVIARLSKAVYDYYNSGE